MARLSLSRKTVALPALEQKHRPEVRLRNGVLAAFRREEQPQVDESRRGTGVLGSEQPFGNHDAQLSWKNEGRRFASKACSALNSTMLLFISFSKHFTTLALKPSPEG